MTTPNVYQLHGNQLSISYSTGELGSVKSFTYQDASRVLRFRGDEIRSVATEIGMLVTVTIHLTVDAGSTSFTLLVPTVNLPGVNTQTSITSGGIITLHRFSIVPRLDQGQTEIYTFIPLIGLAEAIAF